ncbi:MAG: 4Fe-4S dicluster domain-containing protein [Planctomycetes bacterium]|nr:4Fe-4S dicluster domain-containing protein [Planctomycetota bacterium]
MTKAMLIDVTRCIGCRGCQVACKSWNDLPASATTFSETGSNPRYLDCNTFTRVLFRETTTAAGEFKLVFVKRQCMHCREPACASACPVGALAKTPEGPVVYDEARCIGCRYCMLACPFQIPKYEWGSLAPRVRKCDFCADRQAEGLKPACASTCPTGALLFGERDELIEEAHRRIAAKPAAYVPSVYGETIAGGTSMLYLSPVPFDSIGLDRGGMPTDLGDQPLTRRSHGWMSGVPLVAATVGSLAVGLYYLNQRRHRVLESEAKEA